MKKLLKQDVISRTVESLISRSFAEMVFTLPDGLYYWGLYEGMRRVLETMFEQKELAEMLRDSNPLDNPWADAKVMGELLQSARIELANAGMRSREMVKAFDFGGPAGKQKFVNLITDLLKGWSPSGGEK